MRRFHLASLTPFLGLATAAAALALAGCGGGSNGGSSRTITPPPGGGNTAQEAVYVADAGNNNIPVVGLRATGTPFQLGSPASVPSGTTPQDLILDPSRTFVLVASASQAQLSARRGGAPRPSTSVNGAPQLSAYKINADGSLPSTPTSSVALSGLNTTTHAALAAVTAGSSEFVYVAGSGQNALYGFHLNPATGALTTVANVAPTSGTGATQFPTTLATFTLGQGSAYLLVGDTSPNVTDYTVNADGTLTQAAEEEAGESGPVYVAAPQNVTAGDPEFGKVYAYDNGAQDLYVYQVAAGGVLTETTSFGGPYAIGSLSIYPNIQGGALYLTQAGGTGIAEYDTQNATGTPSSTPATTTVPNAQLSGATLDQAGLYLGAVDATPNASRVLVYSLSNRSVGSLLATYALPAGSDPVAATSLILTAFG